MQSKSATQNLQWLYGGDQSIDSSLLKLFLEKHLQDHHKDILKDHWTTLHVLEKCITSWRMITIKQRLLPSCDGSTFWFPRISNACMKIWEIRRALSMMYQRLVCPFPPPLRESTSHSPPQGTTSLRKDISGLWDRNNGIAVQTHAYATP